MQWVDPASIAFKITPHHDLRGIKGGDWDLDRRVPLVAAVKHRSIVQRYIDHREWIDTDLFQEVYIQRIERENVRGAATLQDLIYQYETRVDGMFHELKNKGFRSDHPLPKLLIGRDGDVFIGNQGNHRLAMVHVLGLKKFAGVVICRHKMQPQLSGA